MLPRTVKISERAFFQELTNETVILDMAHEQYWGLDDVGARMWQAMVDHGDDMQQVVASLRTLYNVDETVLIADLAELIDRLREAGLVTVEPAA